MFDDIIGKLNIPKEILLNIKYYIEHYLFEFIDEVTRQSLDKNIDIYLNQIPDVRSYRLATIIEGKHIKIYIDFKKYNKKWKQIGV